MKLLLSSLLVICLLVVGGHSNPDDMLQGGEVVMMGCECAPRHVCNKDGKIIKDGDGLIDPRIPNEFKELDFCKNSEFRDQDPVVCCHEDAPSNTTITPDAHKVTQTDGGANCYYISALLLCAAVICANLM